MAGKGLLQQALKKCEFLEGPEDWDRLSRVENTNEQSRGQYLF
jgi:hypothetical protein